MFLPMMRTERGSSTLPPQAPCLGPLPFLQNKVCAGHINHVQWEAESISWSLLPFWCRSLVLQQSPVQVPRPRPSHSDLTSPGLAQQPDETTHPLPFTSHTEWVQDVLISFAAVYLQSFNPKFFYPWLSTALNEELKMKLEKRRASQEWLLLIGRDFLSQHTQSSVPNLLSLQLRAHPVPSMWKTRDYRTTTFSWGTLKLCLFVCFSIYVVRFDMS